jgi:predicted secreted protein
MGNINTYPVWGDASGGQGKISAWRLRADLTLTSTDFAALGLLASELTSELQITNVSFALSPARRELEEGKLMTEVAKSFKAKALALGQALGYQKVDIKAVQFNQQYGGGIARPMMMQSRAVSAQAVPVPTDGGKSDVVVNLSGTVELEK